MIIICPGCFDILHEGHIHLLTQAKTYGTLIVAINSDESVRRLKGPTRPINTLSTRIENLKALNIADEIISYEEETPLNLIATIKPDLMAKGSDYLKENVIGLKEMQAYGGDVVIIPLIPGVSTTKIIEDSVKKSTL